MNFDQLLKLSVSSKSHRDQIINEYIYMLFLYQPDIILSQTGMFIDLAVLVHKIMAESSSFQINQITLLE